MVLVRRVVGTSMEPALYEGDIVFAWHKKPKKGDIVIANAQGREVIKRITLFSPTQLYIQGDNASHSTDSRHYGPITASDVTGVVWHIHRSRKKK